MISQQIRELRRLFQNDPNQAVDLATDILINDDGSHFLAWAAHETSNFNLSCSAHWTTKKVTIFCNTCGLLTAVPLCLSCFLNSDHENHDIFLRVTENGKCCCGDSNIMEKSSFCKKHSFDDEEKMQTFDISTNNCDYLTDLADICFRAMIYHAQQNNDNLKSIIEFLIQLANINPSYHQLIATAISEHLDTTALFTNWPNFSIHNALLFVRLIETLIRDENFTYSFSNFFYDNYIYILTNDINSLKPFYQKLMPLSTTILLSLSNIALEHILNNEKLIEDLSLVDTLSKEFDIIISSIKCNLHHPIITHSLVRNFFSSAQTAFSFPIFFQTIENVQRLNDIYSSSLELELFPIISRNVDELIFINNYISEKDDLNIARKIQGILIFKKNLSQTVQLMSRIDQPPDFFFFPLIEYMTKIFQNDIIDNLMPSNSSDMLIPFYKRSVLSESTYISCSSPCHSVAFHKFCQYTKDGISDWKQMFESFSKPADDISLLSITIIPIRILAFQSLLSLNQIPKTKRNIIYDTFIENADFSYDIMGKYAASICALSFANDVGLLIHAAYGIFDLINSITSKKLFAFFNFLICSITDRSVFIENDEELLKQYIMNMLIINREMTFSDIAAKCDAFFTIQQDNISKFKTNSYMKNDISLSTNLYEHNCIGMSDKNNIFNKNNIINYIMSLEEIEDLRKNLPIELISCSHRLNSLIESNRCSRILIGKILNEVAEKHKNSFGQIFFKIRQENKIYRPSIFNTARESYDQWSQLIHKYSDFAFTKISLPYDNELKSRQFSPHSVLLTSEFFAVCFITALAMSKGELDQPTIHIFFSILLYIKELNFRYTGVKLENSLKINSDSTQNVLVAKNFNELSSQLPKSFAQFLEVVVEYQDNTKVSFNSLLQQAGKIGNIFFCAIKNDKPDKEKIKLKYVKKQMSYLKSVLHISKLNNKLACIQEIPILIFDGYFGKQIWTTCNKNTKFNAFLPNFTQDISLFDSSIHIDIQKYVRYFLTYDDKNILFEILINMIKCVEYRLRSNPFTITDFRPKLLLGNVFRLLWLLNKNEKKIDIESINKEKIICFLDELVNSNTPIDDFQKILNNYWNIPYDTLDMKCNTCHTNCNDFLFIRYIFIIASCCLWIPIDIPDSIFDVTSKDSFHDLCDLFHLKQTFKTDLPLFSFIKLPTNIFGFFDEQSSLGQLFDDLQNIQDDIAINLINGNVDSAEKMNSTYSLYIILSGDKTGLSFISNPMSKIFKKIDSIYTTQFGEAGIQHGEMLHLNHDKVIMLEDSFLSGEIYF